MNLTKKKWLESLPSRMSSAALILENSTGHALIVKANYKEYWTFPGGIIDRGETPKQAAIREVYEEVGLRIDPKDVTFVSVINRKSDDADTYQFVFKAAMNSRKITNIVLQASEIDECAVVAKSDVLTADRRYGKVIVHWAQGHVGYIEQTFGKDHE